MKKTHPGSKLVPKSEVSIVKQWVRLNFLHSVIRAHPSRHGCNENRQLRKENRRGSCNRTNEFFCLKRIATSFVKWRDSLNTYLINFKRIACNFNCHSFTLVKVPLPVCWLKMESFCPWGTVLDLWDRFWVVLLNLRRWQIGIQSLFRRWMHWKLDCVHENRRILHPAKIMDAFKMILFVHENELPCRSPGNVLQVSSYNVPLIFDPVHRPCTSYWHLYQQANT